MLLELAQENGGAFSDVTGDGVIDEGDMLTVEEVKELYDSLKINKAELLGLRLYTGPMFEFCECTIVLPPGLRLDSPFQPQMPRDTQTAQFSGHKVVQYRLAIAIHSWNARALAGVL